jgi:hypothetical protein
MYAGTKAQSGAGSVLNILTGSPLEPTLVGEITKLTQSGKKNQTADCTNLESTADEFIGTLLSPGNYAITMNRVPGDPGQILILAAFNTYPPSTASFSIVLRKSPTQTTTGDTYSFVAIVEEFNDISDVDPKKQIMTTASLKVSGPIGFVEGS